MCHIHKPVVVKSDFSNIFFSHSVFALRLSPNSPVAGERYSLGLSLSLLSNNHFIKEPPAASTSAVMSNPHPANLSEEHCLDYKLIHLTKTRKWKATPPYYMFDDDDKLL